MPEPFSPEQFASNQEYERQIAIILSARKEVRDPKPWYESAGIVAIFTLIVTAVASYVSQSRAERASRRATQIVAMREAFFEASEITSAVLKMNEERLLLARGKMDSLPESERDSISHNTNLIQQRWRADREKSSIALFLYTGPGVEARWDSLRQSLDRYIDCVEAAYSQETVPDTACNGIKSNTLARLNTFKEAFRERFRATEDLE